VIDEIIALLHNKKELLLRLSPFATALFYLYYFSFRLYKLLFS